MLDAVKRYNVFFDSGLTPPDWGLGLWYRLEAHVNRQEALRPS